jgi:hypothetical protein
MALDLSGDEKLALLALLKRAIADDPFPLSPRVLTLEAVLAKLEDHPPAPAAVSAPSPRARPGDRPRAAVRARARRRAR